MPIKLVTKTPTSPSKRHYLNIFNKVCKIKVLKLKRKLVKETDMLFKNLVHIVDSNILAIVFSIEYISTRNFNVASIFDFKSRSFFYVVAPKNLKQGHIIKSGKQAEGKIGHCNKLFKFPIGCPVYNISIKNNKNSKVARTAGTFALLIGKTRKGITILLSSGKKKLISNFCCGYLGIVSNEFFFLKQIGKAGRNRWLGKKPIVRGVAMNPVDHPNGGGEGKKSPKYINL